MINKISNFFAREERDIKRGIWQSLDEKLLPKDGEIWQHNVDPDHALFHYVKIVCVAYEADEMHETIVVYTRCDEKGLYVSLRKGEGKDEIIIKQPFYMAYSDFRIFYKRKL